MDVHERLVMLGIRPAEPSGLRESDGSTKDAERRASIRS